MKTKPASMIVAAIFIGVSLGICGAFGQTTLLSSTVDQNAQSHVPTSAQITTDPIGKSGDEAQKAVFRVECLNTNSAGTGFLYKSGDVLTAAHVVDGCPSPSLIDNLGRTVHAKTFATDEDLDLALIHPDETMEAVPLTLAGDDNYRIGEQVSTWGFPAGYLGLSPLLAVGVLSGKDAFRRSDQAKIVTQWIVNAAFNHGNSGGPLIDIRTGEVIGIVVSKVVPLKKETINILNFFSNQRTGTVYTFTAPNGQQISISETQLAAKVLADLSGQVQLVIGRAVLPSDIHAFLKANKVEP